MSEITTIENQTQAALAILLEAEAEIERLDPQGKSVTEQIAAQQKIVIDAIRRAGECFEQAQIADQAPCTKTIRFENQLYVCQASGPHTYHQFDFSDKDCDLLGHAVYSPKYYRRVMATAQEALKNLVDVAEYALKNEPEEES